MKKTVLMVSALISFNAFAANEGWKNCDDDGIANCEYQIKDGVLTVRPQDNSQPASIPDYERDCTHTRYAECTTPAPWRWDEDASSVTSLKIETGITSIGDHAFEDMGFTKASLPDSVTSIGQRAFIECTLLADINLPDGLISIGKSGLAGTSLTNVVIPDSVEEVGPYAFRVPLGANGISNSAHIESFVVGPGTILDESSLIFIWDGYGYFHNFDKFKMYCAEGNTSCEAAFQKVFNMAQNQGDLDDSKLISDFLTTYTKDDNGFYQIDDKLYATADLMTHNAACDDAANCQAILNAASQGKPFEVGGKYYATLDLFANGAACTDKKNCEDILSSNGNPFKVGSKIYNSMADFANGNYVKYRIYTIDEANRVAGEVNTIRIKYR